MASLLCNASWLCSTSIAYGAHLRRLTSERKVNRLRDQRALLGISHYLSADHKSLRFRTKAQGAKAPYSFPAARAAGGASNGSKSTYEDSPDDEDVDSYYKDRRGLRGKTEADIIVVGSGIGGLCCGAMLARYGSDVLVLESHTLPGGAAHSFEREGYHFDSGPSLFSGLSSRGAQANPLAQVLDALGERVPCANYDSWMCYLPEGDFLSRIGPTQFFEKSVEPLSSAAMALPPAALRADPGVALTAFARYGPSLLGTFLKAGPGAMGASKLLGPFSALADDAGVTDPFVRNWIDLLSFLLSGMKADATLAAEIVYMFGEWYKPGCVLEYPLGGTDAIIRALVRGLEKHRGHLALGCHVDTILVEGGRATGVRLRNGQVVRAKKAVVSNASVWDTMRLVPPAALGAEYRQVASGTPQCESFMHLHLGFDAKDAPSDLEIHHIVVNDWGPGVDAAQNVVLLSVPSVLDPSLAPPGKHTLHAYTPGTEPFEVWRGLDRRSPEYRALKEERAEVMWKAVERVLGPKFSRDRVEVSLIGTPLTHQRYLRRDRGTYGPAIRAGQGTFPGPGSPIPGLYCCGDSTFPGIGVPAVAASGVVAANTLAPVWDHWKMLDAIGV
eukprot:jgi/Mesen1/5854/ME000298S05133